MRHPERYPQSNSNVSRRNSGGGSSSGSTHRHSHQSSTSGVAALTSPPQVPAYDPSRYPTYTQAHRSSRLDQAYPNGTANNHSSNGAPYQTHPQNQVPGSYNPPHYSWTAYSSTHLQVPTYDTSGRDFNASLVFQTAPRAGTVAQPQQVPTGGFLPHQTAPRRPEPYDAVGYVRSDGEVYDRDELYEEYRPYDSYDHQRGHRGYYYGNNGTSH